MHISSTKYWFTYIFYLQFVDILNFPRIGLVQFVPKKTLNFEYNHFTKLKKQTDQYFKLLN